MTLAAGSRLGPYEVLAAIGAGGMGEVYRARDPRLGRDVAIKVLPASFSADADRLRRFEQEARAAGVLNHPNITAVYDIGQHQDAPYVVQELLEGETLRSILAGSKLSTRKAIEYSLQIVHGLSAAHEKGIVHRDLKPENIFVTNDGRVKILDFGLAKLTLVEGKDQGTNLPTATQGTEPGVVMGTLGYMSPEQVRGRAADARSDIFSFGAILYEMLAGRRAFLGDSAADTMSAILKEDPPDLSVTNQNISPGLERIVRHCLEKSPEQRFHSAHDVAFDLEAVSGVSAAGRADTTAHAKRGRSIWKWALAGVAAAAVIGLALLLAGRLGSPSTAQFRRLTFHRGYIESARFSPDGQTVVYGSTRGDQPLRTYSTRLDSVESRPMDLPPDTTVLGISRTGEMALLLRSAHHGTFIRSGTLARAALGGGNPREILEHVADADISPDGKDLAIVREIGKRQRLEFPAGKLILETQGWVSEPRISPDGTRIAFLEHPSYGNDGGFVAVAPRGGASKRVSVEWQGAQGLAWSGDGKEIWFTAGGNDDEERNKGSRYQLFALAPGGKHRLIYGPPIDLRLYDISPTGRVLLAAMSTRGEVGGFLRGDAKERDLSVWSDEALSGIMADGSAYTGLEQSAPGAGLEPIFYYRRANEAAPVRLGSGTPFGMSPDGRWVAAVTRSEKGTLSLYPTGPGEPRRVSTGAMQPRPVIQEFSRWSADGRRLLVPGGESGRPSRTWLFDLEGNAAPRPVTPEGSSLAVLSPEADSVAAVDPSGKILIYPVAGGAPKEVPGVVPGEIPVEWEASGKALFLWDRTWPARVTRLELDSGKRTVWKELATDTTGLLYGQLLLTRDGQHYIYRLRRVLCELNLADGLK